MNEYTTNQPIGGTVSNEPIFGQTAVICNGTCSDKSTISTCPLHSIFSTGSNPPPQMGSEWQTSRKYCKFHSITSEQYGQKLKDCPDCDFENRASVHFSSKTDDWETPQWLFDEYNTAYKFTLDACADEQNKKCKEFYDKKSDGLKEGSEWATQGNVWMNPPYGREIGKWVEKAFKQSNRHKGKAIVCLLPARTDTKWFHDYCMAGHIRFLKGRLKFSNSKNSAPFPSMIVIFKSEI